MKRIPDNTTFTLCRQSPHNHNNIAGGGYSSNESKKKADANSCVGTSYLSCKTDIYYM